MAVYRDLYSGGDYVIHFKYSGILNIVYLTCMYGVGMPILFPLAALNFVNAYICERIVVAYFMKQPPALDDKLTKNALEMIKYAPLLMLFNGYWMISNQQIFKNTYSFIEDTTKRMISQHYFTWDVNWATPALLMCGASIFLILIQKILGERLMKLGFTLQAKEIEVDEDLPPFLTTVKLSQANEIVAEEKNMRYHFRFGTNDGDTIDSLNKAIVPKRSIQGTPWYQVLSNPKYSNAFMYVGAFVDERHTIIEDGAPDKSDKNGEMPEDQIMMRNEQSDLVMILLNLGYIPDEVIQGINSFMPGWSKHFR